MADGSDVAPLIHQTSSKPCALGVRRRNFSLSVILGVLLLSAVVYFAAQVVFPFAIIRSEQGEYHNHYDRPLFKLPNWLDRGENDTQNKPTAADGSVREEVSAIKVVQATQGAGVGKELQVDSNVTNNNTEVKSTSAQLYVLPKEEADKTGAYCLDGSPPAYYLRKGNREDVVKHNDKSLYFRGRRNLNALIDHLLQAGLGEADRLILGGSSAGAIGTYVGADDVIARLPSSIDVKIVPDSGMFMDLPDKDGVYSFNDSLATAIELHNATSSANKACREARPQDEQWKCAFPENLVPYEPRPLFMLNYLYDKVALMDILRTTCYPDQCQGKDLAAVQNYRTTLLKVDVAQTELHEKDGAFLITCFAHVMNNDVSWARLTVNNKTVRQAVGDWYFGRTADNVHADTGPEMNPVCKRYLGDDTEIRSLWD
uniref:Pectin acetylesterase n=1 Tax=Branchiostoma floridae TaxID=7739 RepID=C3ZME8_BRAFL|eukprot:XP_002590393.1 hypothetical protein BRAFLDRAFT_76667 [Branchiostoma floridae]